MATDPVFASTPVAGSQLLGSAETSLTVPTTTSTLLTAGSSGTKVEEIVVQATGTTVAGLVYVFLYDGSTYHLFDTFTVTAVTASTTVPPLRLRTTYDTLLLKSGWSLRMSQSISGNASILKCICQGGDF